MDHFKDQPSIPQTIGRDEITTAFREVFATASGKRVLFWMLEQCAIYQEAYAGELVNATHYTLGKQGAGRRLIAELDRIDPTLYPRLLLAIADLKASDKAAAASRAASEEGEDHDVDA
ncbi:hypothetical protein FHT78_000343 [Rhizobium sp. BK196]|uniref:hypothetical protein n=1 Tax=Rhizobium sp. BK196 TaxID=2587073 RepID=UPI001621405A|nr:hypothetical protein [Rhizobium sp. BK196]MBB3308614.1 hypothetical protein [Rhizobium sp. BK196]